MFFFDYRTPTLFEVINKSVQGKKKKLTQAKQTGLLTVLNKLVYIRNQNLNAYQKINGLMLYTSKATKTSIVKYSKLYDSVSYTTIRSMLKLASQKSKDLMKLWKNTPVVHCGDNLDIRTKARLEHDGVSYHEAHLYNNIVYKCRIPTDHLDDTVPEPILPDDVDYNQFLLNGAEQQHLQNILTYHVRKSWEKTLVLKHQIPELENKYSQQMTSKTEKVREKIKVKVSA